MIIIITIILTIIITIMMMRVAKSILDFTLNAK